MDFLAEYFGSLNPLSFLSALPGNIAQGIIWGLMGLGVFLTFKLLNFADLSVDGSFATGGAVTAVMLINGCPVWATIIVAILAGPHTSRYSRHSRRYPHTDCSLLNQLEYYGKIKPPNQLQKLHACCFCK